MRVVYWDVVLKAIIVIALATWNIVYEPTLLQFDGTNNV